MFLYSKRLFLGVDDKDQEASSWIYAMAKMRGFNFAKATWIFPRPKKECNDN